MDEMQEKATALRVCRREDLYSNSPSIWRISPPPFISFHPSQKETKERGNLVMQRPYLTLASAALFIIVINRSPMTTAIHGAVPAPWLLPAMRMNLLRSHKLVTYEIDKLKHRKKALS